jgi:hypothetical protein
MRLRAKATADSTENRYYQVAVTDQTQQNPTPELIAGKVLQGVGMGGTAEFFTWQPGTTGLHTLKAEVRKQPKRLRGSEAGAKEQSENACS